MNSLSFQQSALIKVTVTRQRANYSPQARGRSERNFGTWEARLPQELRLHGVHSVEAANRFLREHYIAEFNRRFQVPARERGNAFMRRSSKDLDLIFALCSTSVRSIGTTR